METYEAIREIEKGLILEEDINKRIYTLTDMRVYAKRVINILEEKK